MVYQFHGILYSCLYMSPERYTRVFRRLLLGRRENTGWEEERRKSNVRKKKRGHS